MSLKEIKLPDLGEGVTEGELIKIHVAKGDRVKADQALLEVMTDKASMEIPSVFSGTIQEVKVKEGEIAPVGRTLFLLETSEDSAQKDSAEKSAPSDEARPAKAALSQNQSEKAGAETAALRPLKKEIPNEESEPQEKSTQPVSNRADSFVLSAPASRRLAKELSVDLKNIQGSGIDGAVTRSDLIKHIKRSLKGAQKAPADLTFENKKAVEAKREPLRGIRRIMSETMAHSKRTIPHFTLMETADVSRLVKIRSELKKQGERQAVKITYLPFIMKAVLSALKKFPRLNSRYDEKTNEVVYFKSCHFGFAVDTERGLSVPVIHDVQEKTFLEIAKEIESLARQARDGSIQRENLKDGTFTFTNLGGIGSVAGAPVIYPPQAAIFGIYRIYPKAVKNPQTEIWEERPQMNFSLTCDHRFIDGAEACRFLKACTAGVEEPGLLVMD